jgi:hypothetical protein
VIINQAEDAEGVHSAPSRTPYDFYCLNIDFANACRLEKYVPLTDVLEYNRTNTLLSSASILELSTDSDL